MCVLNYFLWLYINDIGIFYYFICIKICYSHNGHRKYILRYCGKYRFKNEVLRSKMAL